MSKTHLDIRLMYSIKKVDTFFICNVSLFATITSKQNRIMHGFDITNSTQRRIVNTVSKKYDVGK